MLRGVVWFHLPCAFGGVVAYIYSLNKTRAHAQCWLYSTHCSLNDVLLIYIWRDGGYYCVVLLTLYFSQLLWKYPSKFRVVCIHVYTTHTNTHTHTHTHTSVMAIVPYCHLQHYPTFKLRSQSWFAFKTGVHLWFVFKTDDFFLKCFIYRRKCHFLKLSTCTSQV